ncbi:MAG: MBL fold metallo-hydrolase [Clostridia bacterium]|nr:MBL fold metallo-hydrolase [Clostridia bacterium]
MKKIFGILCIILLLTGCSNGANNENKNGEAPVVETEKALDEKALQVSLTTLGRASVRIEISDGRVIYIDPYAGSVEAYEKEADYVFVTHQHSDHNVTDRVNLKEGGQIIECPMDIQAGDQMVLEDMILQAVPAYNENHQAKEACGFILKIQDLTLYHSGDTSYLLEMDDLQAYDIDYALLCMDGYYNMGPEEVSRVADAIHAQKVIPIHTDGEGDYNAKTVEAFNHISKLVVEPETTIVLEDLSKPDVPFEIAIEDVMSERLEALEAENLELYMGQITQRNPYFYEEQERWYMGMIDPSISNLYLEVKGIETIDANEVVVTVYQSHDMDTHYEMTYPLLFKYEDGAWHDYGYHFEEEENPLFTVKYMPGETRVEEFSEMLKDAYDHLHFLYEEKPHPYFEMKLFTDQELLRQRTIPSNGYVFTGWSEPDESLKLFTQYDLSYKGYPGVIQHELVHHITIRICNHNLPVWLLEGIAMYDGSAYYGFESSSLLSNMTKKGVKMSLKNLEAIDTTADLPREEIINFYDTSYMYVRYIVETYGHETLMEMFEEAGKKPFNDSALNLNHELENQETMDEVLMTVLGLTKEDLSFAYLDWLKEVDFIE